MNSLARILLQCTAIGILAHHESALFRIFPPPAGGRRLTAVGFYHDLLFRNKLLYVLVEKLSPSITLYYYRCDILPVNLTVRVMNLDLSYLTSWRP